MTSVDCAKRNEVLIFFKLANFEKLRYDLNCAKIEILKFEIGTSCYLFTYQGKKRRKLWPMSKFEPDTKWKILVQLTLSVVLTVIFYTCLVTYKSPII